MFVSVRDQGGRPRRSHLHGVNKAAWSSKISLLSAVTATSNGSSGSTSTVTQESYTKSKNESSRHRRSSRRKRDSSMAHPAASRLKEKSYVDKEEWKPRGSVDVFSFLVKDEDEDDSKNRNEGDSPQTSDREDIHSADDDYAYSTRSLHSDSGISMDDSSFGAASEILKEALPPVTEEDDMNDSNYESAPEHIEFSWPKVPKLTPFTPPLLESYPVYSDETPTRYHDARIDDEAPRSEQISKSNSIDTRQYTDYELSGYDLIASRLADQSQMALPPIFKKFGKVNYRILLQLQDEIIEMEEELVQLDMADTRSRHNRDGSTTPASRRLSSQWSQSDLHALRMEVLGRLYIKVEQYYQALLSAQKVHQMCSKAPPTDIDQFRAWLRENNPLSQPESHFLDDDDDLITLRPTSCHSESTGLTRACFLPLCISLTSIFPLLIFKLINDILDRLIFLAFLTALATLLLTKVNNKDQRQAQQWATACIGTSFIAAILF